MIAVARLVLAISMVKKVHEADLITDGTGIEAGADLEIADDARGVDHDPDPDQGSVGNLWRHQGKWNSSVAAPTNMVACWFHLGCRSYKCA